ncbi:MAG: hypothetical protein OXR73_35695 [Myxococcales bacterium]|nr:hypothetical protein [Myxococcales bacterium]
MGPPPRHRARTWSQFAPAVAMLVVGCAGTQTAGSVGETRKNEIFGRIQAHEARIEDATAARRVAGAASCPERCTAAQQLAFHAHRICRLAKVANDRDATMRCRTASDVSDAARASDRRADCGCEADP